MEFIEFAEARQSALLRVAFMVTGDRHLAQDLVQAVLVTAWARWSRISTMQYPDAYVQRMLFTQYVSWRRRLSWREVPLGTSRRDDAEALAPIDVDLIQALQSLPRRQRAVIVLRYLQDKTEVETARLLGCKVGTVKSQTAKALASLRTSKALSGRLQREAIRRQT